jgi:hypothetical protein
MIPLMLIALKPSIIIGGIVTCLLIGCCIYFLTQLIEEIGKALFKLAFLSTLGYYALNLIGYNVMTAAGLTTLLPVLGACMIMSMAYGIVTYAIQETCGLKPMNPLAFIVLDCIAAAIGASIIGIAVLPACLCILTGSLIARAGYAAIESCGALI